MISLDKKILDQTSAAARRMVEYGKDNELYIVIPHVQKLEQNLSSSVHVYGSGGSSKVCQFFNTCKTARGLVPKFKINSVTTQDPFFTGLLGLRVSHKFKIPLEVQVHGDFFSGTYYNATFFGKLKNLLAKFVLRHSDSVRTVGERVRASLVKIGVPKEKIYVKPINLNIGTVSKKNDLPNKKYFVWAGRMDPVKNLPFLLEVFCEVCKTRPEARLVLIGEGSEANKLRELVRALGLEKNVTFVGWHSAPFMDIYNASALLLPSLSESYSAVAMEANAIGTPVIMSDVGVANYELKPSDKVTILPINDKEKWVQAILKV